MVKQSIDWGDRTRWYTNARYFNALQTPGSTIRTDKTLRVTSICEGNREILFASRNDILIDGRHKLLLDENGRIKEFDFRNAEGKVIKTRFERTEDKQTDVIMLPDGTKIMLSDHDVTVSHGNKVLSYDTRKDFVRTYDGTPIPPQTIKRGNGR